MNIPSNLRIPTAVLCVALLLPCVLAQAMPRVQASDKEVIVAGMAVFHGSSASQTSTVQQRVTKALDWGASASQVAVQGRRRNYSVHISGVLISSYQGRNAKRMATSFASLLKKAVSIPAVKLPTVGMVIPLTSKRSVRVSGYAATDCDISVKQSDVAPIIDAKYNKATKTLTFNGLGVGDTTLVISGPDGDDSMAVKVRAWAGHVSFGSSVGVTGPYAKASLIKRAVTSAIYRHSSRQPGAEIHIRYITPMDRSLREGAKMAVVAKVAITAPNALPVNYTAYIPVINVRVDTSGETVLRVSNNPETVKNAGRLFEGSVLPGISTRLLYHHLNNTGRTAWMRIELSNPSSQPRSIQLIGANPSARVDPLQLGAIAGKDFLSRLFGKQGMIITLKAHSKMNLFTQRVPDKLSTSGVIQMSVDRGSEDVCGLQVSLDSVPPTDTATELLAASYPQTLSAEEAMVTEKDSIYEMSSKSIQATYEVGKAWQFIRIGEHAVIDRKGNKLYGNYGVVYSVDLNIYNPGSVAKKVRVALEPSGGLADAAFAIGGDVYQLGVLQPNRDYTVKILLLQPGQRKILKIHTMPLAGSNYPVTLVVGS